MALLVLCLIQPPVRAAVQIQPVETLSRQFGFVPGENSGLNVEFFPNKSGLSTSWGFISGEKARVTVVNKDDLEQPIRAEMGVFGLEGAEIARRATLIPPNGFSYMEVDRDEIPLRGEATGRLQVLAKVEIFVRGRALFTGLSTVIGEIINKSTGSDSIWIDIGSPILTCPDCRKSGPTTIPSVTDLILDPFKAVGLIPGQAGRVSMLNDDPAQPLRAELKAFDAEGHQLFQREIVIPPGRFGYVDVNRSDIALPGESPTGRVQMSLSLNFTKITVNNPQIDLIPVSLEIVQEGKTVARLLPWIQKVREAGPLH